MIHECEDTKKSEEEFHKAVGEYLKSTKITCLILKYFVKPFICL